MARRGYLVSMTLVMMPVTLRVLPTWGVVLAAGEKAFPSPRW
jgi:hypothetical protein